MSSRSFAASSALVLLLAACGGSPQEGPRRTRQAFGGGPVGGAFQTFANAMALIVADADPLLDLAAEGTGGSGANLRGVDQHDFDYGICYAGDVYLGRRGLLPQDERTYRRALSVAALYGGVAHLVVAADAGIDGVGDLPGKRIAIGNAGSGAALSATRFFETLGLLDRIRVEFLGYSQAAEALADGKIDGFWVLAAFPNAAATQAAASTDIHFLDLYTPGVAAGFFERYPFYTRRLLTAGAYPGLEEDVESFQDTAFLMANADVSEELVYLALKAIFSESGLHRMVQSHPAAAEMNQENALTGLSAPLHPGASRYWTEIGLTLPDVRDD